MAMKRCFLLLFTLLWTVSAYCQSTILCEYWFDSNFSHRESVAIADDVLHADFETAGLSAGIHTLNLHLRDSGEWCPPVSYVFLKLGELPQSEDAGSATYACWFNNDYASAQRGAVGSGNILLQTDDLSEGIHTLNMLVEINGIQSSLSSYMFLKLGEMLSGGSSGEASSFCYWFDKDYAHKKTGEFHNGNVLLETDSLPSGFHWVNIQVNDNHPSFLYR